MALMWVSMAVASVSPVSEANLGLQIVLAGLVIWQMYMSHKGRREERLREELHRRWAEEDRIRASEERNKIADDVKQAAEQAAAKVAEVAKETRTVLEQKLNENTELTRRNNHHSEKVAIALSVFDKLLERQGVLPPGIPNLREILHEGSQRGTEAADSALHSGASESVLPPVS